MKKETCVSLDLWMTGRVLNNKIRKSGYTIAQIQKELNLSCPQPIYRWMNGQTMPSIDNLYKLSRILKVHMEDLVVPMQDDVWILYTSRNPEGRIRLKKYHRAFLKKSKRVG